MWYEFNIESVGSFSIGLRFYYWRFYKNIDEEDLTSMIQQCTIPRLKYGQDYKLDVTSFNLKLLENKLRQKYIMNRKFLAFDRDS